MKNVLRKPKNNNVLDITKSPRFQREKEQCFISVNKKESGENLECYRMDGNLFGYPSGSIMITRTVFNLSEISSCTIVLVQDANGERITAGETENVIGIVDYIQIDLRRAQ